jgi:hypothetical protein
MTFTYGPGGALVCDEEIAGVTQKLDADAADYYGGQFMIGESMSITAARRIAELLGGDLVASSAAADFSSERS